MKTSPAVSGNAGPKVRSDCEITLELAASGGLHIELESKVKTLYGDSIRALVEEMLNFFGIKNAKASLKDSGALPFVLAARTEAAVKQLIETDLEFLLPFGNEQHVPSSRDRFRYSRLYLPGNNPALMINASLHSAEGLILDLEDSVAPSKKNEARILVRNALRQMSFKGAERMVRINQGETGITDLFAVIPNNVDLILIPKCETAEQVKRDSLEIGNLRKKHNISHEIFLMPVIETALGVENAYSIATASPDVVAMAIGLEDYTADIGVQRTAEGNESLYARMRIVNAARAAGIQPIDSVFSDIDDSESLKKNVLISKALGFEGMGCIHPRQLAIIREGFEPGKDEIEKSRIIITAFEDAKAKGLGVTCIGSKMIDAPVVKRAERIIARAIAAGSLSKDWMKEVI